MKPKLKKWLIRIAVAYVCLLAVGYFFRDFWVRQIRIYAYGLAEVRAGELCHGLPEVDAIEVIALHLNAPKAVGGEEAAMGYRVYGRAELRDGDAGKVAGLWRSLLRGRQWNGTCHQPAYVLRFHRDRRLLFETSVCWMCHNHSLPLGILGNTPYGFDAEEANALALLELLQSHVPLPEKPKP